MQIRLQKIVIKHFLQTICTCWCCSGSCLGGLITTKKNWFPLVIVHARGRRSGLASIAVPDFGGGPVGHDRRTPTKGSSNAKKLSGRLDGSVLPPPHLTSLEEFLKSKQRSMSPAFGLVLLLKQTVQNIKKSNDHSPPFHKVFTEPLPLLRLAVLNLLHSSVFASCKNKHFDLFLALIC